MSNLAREETMATAEQAQVTDKATESEVVNTIVDAEMSVAPRRYFTIPGRDPFDEIEWELRHAHIPGKDSPAFEQKDVEFPKFWSQTATNIVSQKYFRGRMASPERERSVKQMIGRVVDTIGGWGREGGYFAAEEEAETFEAELKAILVKQYASFNSPVWFNVGFEAKPQCSACQPWNALISTPEGMVPIGQLVEEEQVGREVYDASGVTTVVAVKTNGSKEVFRVTLRNGSFVEATADHVVKAVHERRTQPSWLRVDELQPGMRMHLHPHRAMVADRVLVAAGGGSPFFDGSSPDVDVVAVAEAALAGWLQADGFVGQYEEGTNRSLTIEFQVANDDEYAWVIDNLDLVFPDAHRHVRDVPTQDTALRCRRIRLYGENLREFVDRWQLLLRGTAIRVPEQLWTASREEISAYVRSVFQADGYVTVQRENGNESGRVAFAVIGERWVEDIQLLLNVLGIYSRRLRKEEKRDNRHDLHEVQISIGSERARFAELIGFVGADKQQKLLESLGLRGLKSCPDLREEEIVSIESLGALDVYDIQTESGEYLTNNVAVHNCFILSIEDSMESILDWIRREGVIFRGGSGSGVNLSRLRSSKEQLSKGGYASGPVSFMRGADASAGTIKSGGKTRRAAKMVVLDIDHPDIDEFIWCKAKEERKARVLEAAGYDMSLDSPDWSSIQYQNANNSVRVTDAFMEAVIEGKEWNLTARTDGSVVETTDARDLLRHMAEAAWECADPGVQYDTTINSWHTSPNTGRINASNPCSEYLHIDDSACNLASLNLMKFRREDGEFDVEAFEHAVDVMFLAQEIAVGYSSYPTPQIERNAKRFRQLGLGYANLGALLMARGLPYDSDEGRAYAAAITALMSGRAYRKSTEIAKRMGAHDGYAENTAAMIGVIAKHRAAVGNIDHSSSVPDDMLSAARRAWDEALELGEVAGFRNAQATVLAPTGTISFMMDCDTTGVEPDFSLVKSKKLVGGGEITIVNKTVPMALEKLGYAPNEVDEIVAYIDERNTVVSAPHMKAEHYPVFDCAIGDRAIHYMGHVKMMGAVQPAITGALSKTVNLPEETTVDEISQLLIESWQLGVKAIAIYRDNCKVAQPLSGKVDAGATTLAPVGAAFAGHPQRRRIPDDRVEVGRKFAVGEYEGYIHVGLFDDGTPGDIFVDIAKEGTTLAGLMNSFMISVSLGLQYGVPLEVYVSKFSHMRFEPSGMTNDADIRVAKSLVDYIFRWMGKKFLSTDQQEEAGILTAEVKQRLAAAYNEAGDHAAAAEMIGAAAPGQTALFNQWEDAVECARCGGRMVRTGSCYTCRDCGTNTGCS
jgi:adenosylcobalamin-dependent ribonucleoside-diphosphate reductase